jgi:hypothetical protein
LRLLTQRQYRDRSVEHIAGTLRANKPSILGEQMGDKFLREKGKTQKVVVAAIEQGGLRSKVKELARKISTLAISYWHFPK